jgi:hypothetical protein
MIEFHKIWVEHCAAARVIRDRFGTDKAFRDTCSARSC